jgi:hypothetical protein
MTHLFILCSQFWIDFWPNFTSTIFGLLLGLPLALWTNRIFTNAQNRQNIEEQTKRLNNALQILKQTLLENNNRLKTTIDTINDSKVQFDIQLDISAWDAVKDDITQYLHDPNLKRRVAYHFSRLNTIAELNTLYLDFNAGINGTLSNAGNTREALKNHLLLHSSALSADIIEMLPLIENKIQNG